MNTILALACTAVYLLIGSGIAAIFEVKEDLDEPLLTGMIILAWPIVIMLIPIGLAGKALNWAVEAFLTWRGGA